MRGLTGMDIGQIRSLAEQMRREAASIQAMVRHLTAQIDAAPWEGNDRRRFVDEWRQRHAVALQRVIDSLQSAAAQASEHAHQQELASRS